MTFIVVCLIFFVLSARADNGSAVVFWSIATAFGIAFRLRRKRSYPAGRSKAQGATREQLKAARKQERRLLAPEPLLLPDGSMGKRTYWERVTAEAGLPGSTLLQVEATPAGWEYRVELRSGSTLEQVRGAKGALESALDGRPGAITVEQDEHRARVVVLKIQERAPASAPLSWPGPPRNASIYDHVQLGAYIDHDGGPLAHPLYGQHVLIPGASGSGKSVTLNIEVAHVAHCRDAIMVGCDLKGGAELGPWEGAFQSLATTREESEVLLEWVVAMVEYRGPLLKARRLRTWQCTPQEPAIVVFIDEHARLSYSKRAIRAIEQIMEQGRALGIIYVGCLQKPSVDGLGSNRIGPNITVKIVHRVANTNEVGVALFPGAVSDGWAAHEIPKSQPGTLYLHGPDAEHPRLARAFHVTDAQVEQAVGKLARVGAPRPGLAAAASPPAGAAPPDNTNPDEEDGSGTVLAFRPGGGEAPDELLEHLPPYESEGLHYRELIERTGIVERTLFRRLKKLADAGLAVSESGHWRRSS